MANCLVRAFVIGSLTFYYSMILSAQVHGMHNFIGLCSQLTNVQSTKSEAAVTVRKKAVSCFTPTCVNTVDACL